MKSIKRALFGTLSVVAIAAAASPAVQASIDLSRNEGIRTEARELAQSETLIASGSFVTVEQDHPTSGTARIISEGGQRYAVFDDGFTTARGPAVEVVLYRGDSVPVNLAEGSYRSLATLQSFDGGQRYAIPADVDLDEFGAIAIWCEEFNVTFGYAALTDASTSRSEAAVAIAR